MKKFFSVLLVSVLGISMVACTTPTTSQLVTALNAVSDAASVATVVTSGLVALGSLDAPTAATVSTYAQGVTNAVQQSITELNSTDTNPNKIAVITADFANVVSPAFGANSPQVSAAITAVSAAIKLFLSQLHSVGVLKLARAVPMAQVTLTKGDKTVLKKVWTKCDATRVEALKFATVQ